jgi:excisionase family DNA binding protein
MRRVPVRDAATELGCSRDAVYRMIRKGQIEYIELPNGRMVIEQQEIDRIVEQGRTRRRPDTVWEPPTSRGRDGGYIEQLEAMANGRAA